MAVCVEQICQFCRFLPGTRDDKQTRATIILIIIINSVESKRQQPEAEWLGAQLTAPHNTQLSLKALLLDCCILQ